MKIALGPESVLYPSLTTIAGAHVKGKPTFITIAHVGIMDLKHISLGMAKIHYTNQGIKDTGEFSVNIPSTNLIPETDYCGLVSGKNTDKSILFDIFYGQLKNAPMINQCPVCMECKLERIVDFSRHDVFVGKVVATHADEYVLQDGKINIGKVKPLLFDMPLKKYWALGEAIGKAWHDGKKLKTK